MPILLSLREKSAATWHEMVYSAPVSPRRYKVRCTRGGRRQTPTGNTPRRQLLVPSSRKREEELDLQKEVQSEDANVGEYVPQADFQLMGLRHSPNSKLQCVKSIFKQLQKRGSLHQRFQRLMIHYHISLETAVVLMTTGHSYLMRPRKVILEFIQSRRRQCFLGFDHRSFPTRK